MIKATPDNLDSVINEILKQYGDEIDKHINDAVDQVSKAGVQALKTSSRNAFNRTGRYAKGWAVKKEKGRLTYSAEIHNKDRYQLAHLLEYGHANRDGGRTSGRAHIKPIEEQINRNFENAIVKAIT